MKQGLILFGATGDLARLKILPALERLTREDFFPDDFLFIPVGRREMTNEEYFEYLRTAQTHSFSGTLAGTETKYLQLDFDQTHSFQNLINVLAEYSDHEFTVYLSLGPDIIEEALQQLCEFQDVIKQHQVKFVIEKPFGSNTEHSRRIEELLCDLAEQDNIFRNDHYLHKGAVQSLNYLLQQDIYLRTLIANNSVESLKLIVSEEVDVGTRANYFDGNGMLVDWFQSHCLQLLAILLDDNTKNGKLEFLNSLEIQPHMAIRAQYEGYTDLSDVPEESSTETFFGIKFTSSLEWLQNINIEVVAGKALAEKNVFIELIFTHPHLGFGKKLLIKIDPPGGNPLIEPIIKAEYDEVLLQAMMGDNTNFVTADEVQAQWELTEKTRTVLEEKPLQKYTKGTSWKHFCGDNWC